MTQKTLEFDKQLGGVEDLLLDATSPSTVTQNRAGEPTEITKINADTIPAEGAYGKAGFKSIAEFIQELSAGSDNIFVRLPNSAFGIAIGGAGLDWDSTGGALSATEMALVQQLNNGKYRWIAKAQQGSDNWVFRGRISGRSAVFGTEFVTKDQLDTVVADIDIQWSDISNTPNFLTSVPNATTTVKGLVERATNAEAAAGNDTTRYVTPAQMKAFSDALPAGALENLEITNRVYPTFNALPSDYSHQGDEDRCTYLTGIVKLTNLRHDNYELIGNPTIVVYKDNTSILSIDVPKVSHPDVTIDCGSGAWVGVRVRDNDGINSGQEPTSVMYTLRR